MKVLSLKIWFIILGFSLPNLGFCQDGHNEFFQGGNEGDYKGAIERHTQALKINPKIKFNQLTKI